MIFFSGGGGDVVRSELALGDLGASGLPSSGGADSLGSGLVGHGSRPGRDAGEDGAVTMSYSDLGGMFSLSEELEAVSERREWCDEGEFGGQRKVNSTMTEYF